MSRLGRLKFGVHPAETHLVLRCHGTFDLEPALDLFAQGLERASAAGFDAVLIDARDDGGEPTTGDRYQMGVQIAELCARYEYRVRLAVVGQEPLIDPQRFGELVARNRAARAAVFTDVASATAWIRETADPAPSR